MGLKDIFSKDFYDQYMVLNAKITPKLMLVTLAVVAVLVLFVLLIYRLTYTGALYSSSYAISMLLSAMVTSLIILPISSNVALSIGTGGVLSMVRYRTAVKDPRDIAFMFWSIAIGLTCGIGFYVVAVAGTIFIGALIMGVNLISNLKKGTDPCIAVIKLSDPGVVDKIRDTLGAPKVKSITIGDTTTEITVEMKKLPSQKMINNLKANEKVVNMAFIKYNGDLAL
ncbi:MAG: DUF4956 domain-containing protein [Eubacteriaceae bacterium]|nr:DUF4956 domain-containing protein [Eubacteriaceae bacterium]